MKIEFIKSQQIFYIFARTRRKILSSFQSFLSFSPATPTKKLIFHLH